jgi:hypothetical protein
MVARGYSSETFAYEAVASRGNDKRDYHVYYFGDFDRSGIDAANSLQEKLERFAKELSDCVCNIWFHRVAITLEQIQELGLPTRDHKRDSAADRKWRYDFACELDAMPPDQLRELVRHRIEYHLPRHQLATLKVAEESERELFLAIYREAGAAGMFDPNP